MDSPYSENSVSLSPSHVLNRLQILRQLQLLQRGKLQKQQLMFLESPQTSSNFTEIISHFGNSTGDSTSYNTFQSLLRSPPIASNEETSQHMPNLSTKVQERDLVDGISLLNLSQESEMIIQSPLSSRSPKSEICGVKEFLHKNNEVSPINPATGKRISLDEMPIIATKNNFESLIDEKLKVEEKISKLNILNYDAKKELCKKPFLRRGVGMSRFGVQKNHLVIQNTKSLPWKQNTTRKIIKKTPKTTVLPKSSETLQGKEDTNSNFKPELVTPDTVPIIKRKAGTNNVHNIPDKQHFNKVESSSSKGDSSKEVSYDYVKQVQCPKGKHPLLSNKNNKTWVSIFTKDQEDFLRKLKQTDYYKNFASPSKSSVSDVSCDNSKLEKELIEQKMFELLERKVTNESFCLENSFFNRFLKNSQIDFSGESTPLIMKKCLADHPELLHISPNLKTIKHNTHTDVESCQSDYTDSCSEDCDCSHTTCCSCKTVEETNNYTPNKNKKQSSNKEGINTQSKKDLSKEFKKKSKNTEEIDIIKTNMEDMNQKLIATSDILKERLCELEDEIETFRKENANLTKMREEVDQEKQKFLEEKQAFEQKFNEDKILSEYYLAEEKEKLLKQKQTYDRYVREMRGRLNKKEKEEVTNLKNEINNLREEIRLKDTKSTSLIARLRNQLKIIEKEKRDLQEEVEKLKKENRRIQHSNDITRRLSNMKYLEEINQKLSKINSKNANSEVVSDKNIKYKAFGIERLSRGKNRLSNSVPLPRAKSVPNLNVTSRYAKYFSQRDSVSQIDGKDPLGDLNNVYVEDNNYFLNESNEENEYDSGDNNLEKLYLERFKPIPTRNEKCELSKQDKSGFFIQKSKTQLDHSKSPSEVLSPYSTTECNEALQSSVKSYYRNQSHLPDNSQRSKSPETILSSKSSSRSKEATVVDKADLEKVRTLTPEPSSSKTNLNPIEIKNLDGSRELRFPNGNVKHLSGDGKYSKFVYYNGDVKETFFDEGTTKYFYAESQTYHTTHPDGLEVLEFPDGQVEKRYKDGSSEIHLANGSIRYFDPKNKHVREEWRFPDGTVLTVSSNGEQRIMFPNGQVEIHGKDHKRREYPDGTVKLVYNDGTSETRYASGRVRIKDKQGNLIMDSAPV